MRREPKRRTWGAIPSRLSTLAGLVFLVVTGSNCVQLPTSQPKAAVSSFQTATNLPGRVTPTILQDMVMRMADSYATIVAQAADDFAARAGTPEARQTAARMKAAQVTAATTYASGHNPVINALDMVVLISVSRMVVEDYFVGKAFGESARPLLETSRRMESNAWVLVQSVLQPAQQEELRGLIAEWRRQNPEQRYVAATQFWEFAGAAEKLRQQASLKPTSLLGLLLLDPMAGLDPTVRAIEESRYFAERAMYYLQRMPMLLSWQMEFLTLQLADQPAARQILTNAESITASMQAFARTAEQLPELVDEQRQAALQQLLAGVATERSNILASLTVEEERVRGLLSEVHTTLDAAHETAGSVKETIESLDAFVRFVTPDKSKPVVEPAHTNRRPFNVLDYGTAAGQIGEMARDLNVVLSTANESVPQVAEMGQQASANLDQMLQRAFWRVLILILILLAGSVGAALLYRVLLLRFTAPGQTLPGHPKES